MNALKDPRWLALSEKRRKELLERYRTTNVGYGWWDMIHAFFRERMQEVGVAVEAIFFSGFWSQGDGASFAGCVSDWTKFLTALGRPEVAKFIRLDDRPALYIRVGGRYSHSHSMRLDGNVELEAPEDYESLQLALWETVTECGMVLTNMESQILAFLRGEADDLYRELESEYWYLTDDEQVVAWLVEHLLLEDLTDETDEEEEDNPKETPNLLAA